MKCSSCGKNKSGLLSSEVVVGTGVVVSTGVMVTSGVVDGGLVGGVLTRDGVVLTTVTVVPGTGITQISTSSNMYPDDE